MGTTIPAVTTGRWIPPQMNGGDMSAASITARGFQLGSYDNVGVEFSWTGTPTGTLKFQASNSSTDGTDGNWFDIAVTFTAQPAGSAGGVAIDLNNLPFAWVRAVYTRASGTGALTAIFNGKQV